MTAGTPVQNSPHYYDRLYHLVGQRYERDFDVYAAIVSEMPHARVLDLGGGFGRLAKPIATLGHPVTVVDCSAEMIDLGRDGLTRELPEIAGRVEWLLADITKPIHDLPLNWYHVALCAHHTVNELLDGLDGFFANVASHLETAGIAAIAALPEAPYERPGVVEFLDGFRTADRAEWIVTTAVVRDEPRSHRHRLYFFYDEFRDGVLASRHVRWIDRRVWTRTELESAAEQHGLRARGHHRGDGFFLFEKVGDFERR